MAPYQERVVTEKAELDDKVGLLRAFIKGSAEFKELPRAEQLRLHRQDCIMGLYSEVLDERIDAFESSDAP